MQTILHQSDTRGHADHGWLNTYHTFSFANYFDPQRMNFGALRVINDDTIAGGGGFGRHPHADMEIITIPLQGALQHTDDMGNHGVIRQGEVQVMSAGTGVMHSEMNASPDEPVKLLQIWVMTGEPGAKPRYDQISVADGRRPNEFRQIVSPDPEDSGTWIRQQAWFNLIDLDSGVAKEYRLHRPDHGVYAFVIDGQVKIGEHVLNRRDGLGVWETDAFTIESIEPSELLLMEVPMN